MLKAKFVFKRLLNKVRKNLRNAAYYNIFARVSMEFPRFRDGSYMRIIIFHEIIGEGYGFKLNRRRSSLVNSRLFMIRLHGCNVC